MGRSDLCTKIEMSIASCEARYKAHENDSYLSTVLASEMETLQILLERVKGTETEERLLAELRAKLPELEQELDREAEYPTFDWYDEHHVYKVLEGHRDAYRKVISILEENASK